MDGHQTRRVNFTVMAPFRQSSIRPNLNVSLQICCYVVGTKIVVQQLELDHRRYRWQMKF